MDRAFRCKCGERVTGHDDAELFRVVRLHVHEDHPDWAMTDGQIRDQIAAQQQVRSQ